MKRRRVVGFIYTKLSFDAGEDTRISHVLLDKVVDYPSGNSCVASVGRTMIMMNVKTTYISCLNQVIL